MAYGENLVSRVLEESTTLYGTYEQPVGEQNFSESTVNGSSLYDYVTVGPNEETVTIAICINLQVYVAISFCHTHADVHT